MEGSRTQDPMENPVPEAGEGNDMNEHPPLDEAAQGSDGIGSAEDQLPSSQLSLEFMDPELYKAATQGNAQFVEQRRGEPSYDFLATTPQKNTALHITARFGHADFAWAILSFCPTLLDQQNEKGDTALHVAARGGFIGLVQLLIDEYMERARQPDVEQGFSLPAIRKVNNSGNTALHEALLNRHGRVARRLLSVDGEQFSIVSNNGESPLYLAAEFGFTGIVGKILRQGSGISLQGPGGKTPLHAAAIKGRIRTVKMLMKRQPQLIGRRDNFGRSALHYAATTNIRVTLILLKHDKSLAYVTDEDGLTPLHIATRYWRSRTAGIILDHCPDCIEVRDASGKSALHIAATVPYMVSCFLKRPECKDLISEADNDGNTPLHLATKCHYYRNVARILEFKSVDLRAKNNEGQTALDICELMPGVSLGKRAIWRALRRHDAVPSRARLEGRLPENLRHPFEHADVDLRGAANTLSVVAALLATVSCAAAFTVPGGYKNDAPREGLAVLARKAAFKAFLVSDVITMCVSLTVTYALNWALWGDRAMLSNVLNVCMPLVWAALIGVSVAFATGTFVVVAGEDLGLAIVVCIIACMTPVVPVMIFKFAQKSRPPFRLLKTSRSGPPPQDAMLR